jgi:hypothetical protein
VVADGVPGHDQLPGVDVQPGPDGPTGFFKIQGVISFDPKMCGTAPTSDCKGPLIWGIYTKPLTSPDPGNPLFLSGVLGAKQGTAYSGDKVPIAPKMYLNAFVDDNNTATLDNPWPDKGDPLHVDVEPFTASPGSTVTRNIGFWVRMP